MSDMTPVCMRRRDLLALTAGGVAMSVLAPDAHAQSGEAERASLAVYPEKTIARLSELKEGVPLAFTYPLENHPNQLIKLGAEALRGVGPEKDVVAFSVLCTHMGGNLNGRYRHDVKALGPCPFHFSVFDLRKGGMPVHASATQNLPQVLLRVEGNDVIAIGVVGLIYGQRNNLADGKLTRDARPGRANAPRIMRG